MAVHTTEYPDGTVAVSVVGCVLFEVSSRSRESIARTLKLILLAPRYQSDCSFDEYSRDALGGRLGSKLFAMGLHYFAKQGEVVMVNGPTCLTNNRSFLKRVGFGLPDEGRRIHLRVVE